MDRRHQPETNSALNEPVEAKENRKPKELVTDQGSVYTYLPDGRTQRFKEATGETMDPQDVIVFIPPWDTIKADVARIYPEIFGPIENEIYYQQLLLEYAQLSGRTMKVIDEKGGELSHNSEVGKVDRPFLAFIDRKDDKRSFSLPVSKIPKIGYLTFDTRKFVDEKGETMRERHIGNKVSEIRY